MRLQQLPGSRRTECASAMRHHPWAWRTPLHVCSGALQPRAWRNIVHRKQQGGHVLAPPALLVLWCLVVLRCWPHTLLDVCLWCFVGCDASTTTADAQSSDPTACTAGVGGTQWFTVS